MHDVYLVVRLMSNWWLPVFVFVERGSEPVVHAPLKVRKENSLDTLGSWVYIVWLHPGV